MPIGWGSVRKTLENTMDDSVKARFSEAVDQAAYAGSEAADRVRDGLKDAGATGVDAIEQARKALQDALDLLRGEAPELQEKATQGVEQAHSYLTRQIKENPIPAVLAGLGAGMLLGFLLKGSSGPDK
jgi:ElaB/YqjD/DUF883 family membrane-anchored ribosome-binding protein